MNSRQPSKDQATARRASFLKALAVAALAGPLAFAAAGPASADHRHGGWYGGGWHGSRHHHHHRHWRGHGRHHHGSGISGLFIFDLTPPPPPRPVVVLPPPIVHRAQPPAYCREYTTTVTVNGRPVETYGTACLQPDGRWRIVSMN